MDEINMKLIVGQKYAFDQLNKALFGTSLNDLLGSKEDFEKQTVGEAIDKAIEAGLDHDCGEEDGCPVCDKYFYGN